jgi:hypothetical protein
VPLQLSVDVDFLGIAGVPALQAPPEAVTANDVGSPHRGQVKPACSSSSSSSSIDHFRGPPILLNVQKKAATQRMMKSSFIFSWRD